jgi:preprotein translocase subunit SecD
VTFIFVLFSFLFSTITFFLTRTLPAGAQAADAATLDFRLIIPNQDCQSYPNFERGSTLISNYRDVGLPDCFLISKDVALCLSNADISSIDVSKNDSFGLQNVFKVSIRFNSGSISQIEKFTSDNLRHRVAISINNKILTAPTILEPLHGDMVFSVSSIGMDELASELSKLGSKLNVK